MRLLDEEFADHNFKGVLGLRGHLRLAGHPINAKRGRRLVRLIGHAPVYPKPRLSVPGQGVTPYPCLLQDCPATAPNEVWSTDITYVLMAKGFRYLAAVLDWHARDVLSGSSTISSTWASAFRIWPMPCAWLRLRTSSTPTRAASLLPWPTNRPCWPPHQLGWSGAHNQ